MIYIIFTRNQAGISCSSLWCWCLYDAGICLYVKCQNNTSKICLHKIDEMLNVVDHLQEFGQMFKKKYLVLRTAALTPPVTVSV